MTAGKPIRIGIIGSGNIGNVHMETLKKVPEAEIAAVTDVYLPLAESRAKQHNIERVYESSDKLLADPSIDAVVIAVSNEWHAPIAIQALEAGKHVMLEKPMALNLESARRIVEAERKAGKVLMIPHQLRWEALSQSVKQQVEKGALGSIYHAKAGWLRRKGIPGWGTWFTQMDKSGGGPLIDLGVHMLDLSLYLMGNPKPVSVYGATYAEFGPRKKGIGTWGTPNWDGKYDVEDLATALIKLENGATLSLDVSWAALIETDSQPYVQLLGSEGGASIRGTKGKLLAEVFDREADVTLTVPETDEGSRVRMMKHFVSCIQNGQQPITSVMTGYTNNLILDAIYTSSQTGNEVKLNWDIE
ncbi:Gfo/Idh/MocA family protein [Paenibacillus sp. GCM10023248]|uniref:Gfo/Idh/MocA family protein n=1 Tax=Bacillales TaxID=1385 RepID=UPI00237941BA|nr:MULTISPECIES: Gfo/Idh/MocA family oxidoreductase [Bacillales]MDD9267890.1 Gfo/Idh/MocA family oxidoreductase [Paenibacillus sp. MAHUQ-63]MDR6882322.1 putative dehydrogenase [Bacillus sp. 3255]